MTTRAVLFDMGGTLIEDEFVHPGEVFQKILISLGIPKSLEEVKMAFLNAEKEAEDINLLSLFGKMQREEYWLKWDSLVLKHLSIAEDNELVEAVQSKWFDHSGFTLYPEVKLVLSRLKQKELALGLTSNAYEEGITRILEKANLEKSIFDIIVGVDTVQCMKPHPEFFKYALRKLKVRPEEALFVGDRVDVDYEGAEKVGIKAILVEREVDITKPSGLRTIGNLKEIFRYIE